METSHWWTIKPPSEEAGVRNRSREDQEESPIPFKRLRTSYGQQPPHVEAVGKAEDFSEAREVPRVPGSSAGSQDADGSVSGPSSSVESSDHCSARISSSSKTCLTTYSTADFEALYEELERLGQGGFGSVFAGYRKEDRLPVAIKHIPMDMVEKTQVTLTEVPLEVTLTLRAAEDQPDAEGPDAVALLLDLFQLDQELILVQERPPETTEISPWWTSKPPSEEAGVRQRKISKEDQEPNPEEGPTPFKSGAVGKAEDSFEACEDPGVPGSSAGSWDTDGSASGPSSSVESSDHCSAQISSSSKTCLTTYSTANFEALYEELERLGQGGFGSVFAGYRKEDRLPVAIKHIPMDMVEMTQVTLNGQLTDVPLEVFLMLRATEDQPDSEGPGAVVFLLDWFQLDQELILVQERPRASVDLLAYMRSKGSELQEQDTKMILHQLVIGIQGLHSRGVLHRDIKPENLLVETGSETPRVRIIDLGCGCLHNNGLYLEFNGTDTYIPPEWWARGSYRANPMTVWQVGVLLYELLTGDVPFQTKTEIIWKKLPRIESDISPDCRDFVRRCLTKRALGRPPLESLLLHPWLQGARDGDLVKK